MPNEMAFALKVSAPLLEVFFSKHFEHDMPLTSENATAKNTIASTLEALAGDELADEGAARLGVRDAPARRQRALQRARDRGGRRSAAAHEREARSALEGLEAQLVDLTLLGKEERGLLKQPNMYFKLLTEVCLTHPEHNRRLLEDSDGSTELDALVEQITSVEKLTDPTNEDWIKLCEGKLDLKDRRASPDEIVDARADCRAQKITSKDLCNRMIDHVAENLNREINSGYDTVKVNTTVLEIMCAILEKVHPKSDADEHEIKAYIDQQYAMMDYGGARLVLEIIGSKNSLPLGLVEAAINFGIEMLDGAQAEVQADMFAYFSEGRSDQFFANCRGYIIAADKAVRAERSLAAKGAHAFESEYEQRQHFTMGLIEFLRLMMEGHNRQMQDLMRDQEENKKSFNLLVDVVNLIATIAKDQQHLRGLPTPLVEFLEKLLDFLVEATQGPCPKNQEFLAMISPIIDVIKRLLVSAMYKPGCNETLAIAYARVAGCRLLSGILEGSNSPGVFHALSEKVDHHFFRQMVTEKIHLACSKLEDKRRLGSGTERRAARMEEARVRAFLDRETCAQRCRRGSTIKFSGPSDPAAVKERERAAADMEYDQLLECGYELVNTFMKLAARDDVLMDGIQPRLHKMSKLKTPR